MPKHKRINWSTTSKPTIVMENQRQLKTEHFVNKSNFFSKYIPLAGEYHSNTIPMIIANTTANVKSAKNRILKKAQFFLQKKKCIFKQSYRTPNKGNVRDSLQARQTTKQPLRKRRFHWFSLLTNVNKPKQVNDCQNQFANNKERQIGIIIDRSILNRMNL